MFLLDHPVCLFVILSFIFTASFQPGSLEERRYNIADSERRTQISSVQTALLALVGMMLGFTFAMALSRFDLPRQLVVDEADSVGTTRLRASLLPDKYRTEIDSLRRDYLAARLDFFGAASFIQSLNQTFDMCEKLPDALENRIPIEVWRMLVLVAVAGCFLTGSSSA